jgi:capsular polysaccharide biosynthesis protein
MNQQTELDAKVRQNEEMEIDLLELLDYFREHMIVILLGFLAGALIAGLITFYAIKPSYTATAKMYMVSSSTQSVVDLTDLNIGQSLSKDYVELLKTRPIIEAVIEEQSLPYNYNELTGMLQLSVISDTRIIAIKVTSQDPEEAMVIANALADKGVKELPKLMETPEPHIAEYAIIPINPSSPSMSRNVMMGALIGMILVLGLYTVQFLLDDTFKSADDIEREFGVIPLTVIPEGKIAGFESTEKTKRERRKKGSK